MAQKLFSWGFNEHDEPSGSVIRRQFLWQQLCEPLKEDCRVVVLRRLVDTGMYCVALETSGQTTFLHSRASGRRNLYSGLRYFGSAT